MVVSQISLVLAVLANQMGIEQGASVGCLEQTGLLHSFLTLLSPCRGELCQLLEENSLLKSQLRIIQQELRLAKEKGSEHDE